MAKLHVLLERMRCDLNRSLGYVERLGRFVHRINERRALGTIPIQTALFIEPEML